MQCGDRLGTDHVSAFSLPFAIWMLSGFVKAVPEALEEAAATSVFSFISAWNDFLFAKSFCRR
ncbi:conserved hypothetical protein [Streptomyces sviceus ATCC 29083]|uniref:Uncharacterized protein n=1 Tax=Streptomyces sviceus (strain ATCC 29083 / DSM 924 / JCM 4929 / NBRC 13980 / NCIMB 11184 / NRRL 5439 / UC 5370) TaxID=463191 RepID=B5HNZ4_STRX2|nr:conserved hypothetical protein [Streptomyces sviceus ATCC 29083]